MVSQSASSGVTAFLSWWGQELYGLLPGTDLDAGTAAARILIAIEPDGLRLAEQPPGKSAGPQGAVPVSDMIAYLAARARGSRKPPTVGLRLPYSACFVRRVELPAVARRDIGRMLAMDLERSTPFKTKDVLTAFEVDDAASAKGQLKVRHLIIKRKSVEPLKTEIEALGLPVTRIECLQDNGGGPIPVNFLATEAQASPAPRQGGLNARLLALTAAGLAASAAYLYVDRHEKAWQNLQAQSAKLKVKAMAQKEALAKSQLAFAEIANYQKLRADMVSKVAILEELTRILPDNAWVTDLKIDGTTVDISGLAASAAALVPVLERSKVFVDATSTASLTFDPREEKERFSIRARIRSASTSAGTAVPPGKSAEAVR